LGISVSSIRDRDAEEKATTFSFTEPVVHRVLPGSLGPKHEWRPETPSSNSSGRTPCRAMWSTRFSGHKTSEMGTPSFYVVLGGKLQVR